MYSSLAPIKETWREWTFLNPNSQVNIEWEGMVFPTLTHALNATKTKDMDARLELTKQHPFWVSNWGEHRPFADEPYRQEWEQEIADLTLILTATKFGLVDAKLPMAKLDDRLRFKLAFWLTLTQGRDIRYENQHCDTYWGLCYCNKHRSSEGLTGRNALGQAMMTIRSRLIRGAQTRSFTSGSCDWCYAKCRQKISPAKGYIVFFKKDSLVVHSFCRKHDTAEKHDARKLADGGKWFVYDMHELPSEVSIDAIARPSRVIIPRSSRWERPTQDSGRSQHQMGFNGWSRVPSSSYSSCSSSTTSGRDLWGTLIIKADGTESNHVVSSV